MDCAPIQPEPSSLASKVGAIAALINGVLTSGDVAALRKLRPGTCDCAAFWRLAALQSLALPESGPARDEAERRWACIIQAMATMKGAHQIGIPLGRALAQADIAELRVLRLLRATGSGLADAVRVTSHYLAQKAIQSNQVELAALVLSDGRTDAESVRRRIARSYYSQKSKEA